MGSAHHGQPAGAAGRGPAQGHFRRPQRQSTGGTEAGSSETGSHDTTWPPQKELSSPLPACCPHKAEGKRETHPHAGRGHARDRRAALGTAVSPRLTSRAARLSYLADVHGGHLCGADGRVAGRVGERLAGPDGQLLLLPCGNNLLGD